MYPPVENWTIAPPNQVQILAPQKTQKNLTPKHSIHSLYILLPTIFYSLQYRIQCILSPKHSDKLQGKGLKSTLLQLDLNFNFDFSWSMQKMISPQRVEFQRNIMSHKNKLI